MKLAEGILAAAFGLAVSYLLVLGLDRLVDTPAWLRGIILAAGAAVPGLGLPLKWHAWVWKQRRLEDAARLLRWKFPRLGDQLLGIVELARHDAGTSGRSERLVQAAMAQADEAVKDQDFSGAVPKAKHRQWGLAAAAGVALVTAGFIFINDAARNALVRWLMPWRETERYTFARIEKLPNPLIVPVAESFELPVKVSRSAKWQPDTANVKIAGQPDLSEQVYEEPGENDWLFARVTVPPQTKDTDVFVQVGDVRETIRLEPRPRPELTSLQVRTKLPAYLEYKTEPVTEVRGGAVSILKGAEVSFEAAASRELAEAKVDGAPATLRDGKIISPVQKLEGDKDVVFTWTDGLGLTSRVPLILNVKAVEDAPAQLVARRETMEQVVLESEVVVFDVNASDDFGIKQTGLEWKSLNDGTDATATKTVGSKITAGGGAETKSLEARSTFCAAREGVAPQSLEIRAWAEDYLPGREKSRSAAFVLHVLNKTDHALWVTQQMSKWLEAARETYEKEQQLHATNKELRSMTAEELDRTENRKKIALQSSAENANAERLAALNNAGKNLVEQATKNPEFDAERLESWATTLQSLNDIAQNRMPNVADLLKKSADAKADAKMAAAGKPGESGESKPGSPSESKPGEPNPSEAKPGEGKPSDSQNTAQNSEKPDPAKSGVPSDSGKSAPQISQGPKPPPGENKPGAPADPNADPKPKISISDGSMDKKEPPTGEKKDDGAPKPPASGGKFTLPGNSLAGGPQKPGEEEKKPESSAQEKLDEGVKEQRDLLAEFAKVSDQLTEILSSLEASTFVKRLKLASREQQQLAGSISQKTLAAFGIFRERSAVAAVEEKEDKAPKEDKQGKEEKEGDELADGKQELHEFLTGVRITAQAWNNQRMEPDLFAGMLQTVAERAIGGSWTRSLSQEEVDAYADADMLAEVEAEFAAEKKKEEATRVAPKKKDKETAKTETKENTGPFVTEYAPMAHQKAKDQSEAVRLIQSDMEAFMLRRPDNHFKKVIEEMKGTRVVQELKRVGERAADNLSGYAIHGAENWSDTLDRWAEEMVKAAGKCSSCSSGSKDSLPPEIVLKVMQALRDEMKLRDETRELENSRSVVRREEYSNRAVRLASEQARIADHTQSAVDDIMSLADGDKKFGKELQLLNAVVAVMDEAMQILESPETGPKAVAAETEAIELLLQTKRQNPKGGGGGGGGDPGGGSTAGSAKSAALSDIGPGSDAASSVKSRPVGQATGRAGREFPEEFKSGLDSYFSNLEGTGTK